MNPRATPLSPSAAAVPGRHLVPPRLCCSLLTRLPASGPQSLPCVLSSQVLFAMSQVLSHQSRCFQNGPRGPTRPTLPPRPRLGPSRPAAPASGPWRSLAVPLCPPCLPSDTLCRPHLFPPPKPWAGGCLLRLWMESVPEHGWPLQVPAWEGASWRAVRGGVTAGQRWEPGRKRGGRRGLLGRQVRDPRAGSPRVLPSCSVAPDRCSGHRKDVQALPLPAGSVPSCAVSPDLGLGRRSQLAVARATSGPSFHRRRPL